MFDEFSQLEGEKYSREEIEVLNCDFSNTFIRGWDKSRTLDLVCKKIRTLLELEDFLYPKEILIVLRSEGEKLPFLERLSTFLQDKHLMSDIEFYCFDDFLKNYAPKEGRRWNPNPVSLKKEWKLIFMIDPETAKRSDVLVKLLKNLFPREGAKLFLWEYENFMDPIYIRNDFPGAELIHLSSEETSRSKWDGWGRAAARQEKERNRLLAQSKRSLRKIVKEIRREQNSRKSFRNFQILVSDNENEELLRETFLEILRNEFEVFLWWMETNRLNCIPGGSRGTNITHAVREWGIYNQTVFRQIRKGNRTYERDFMKMFQDLGIKGFLAQNDPDRLALLAEIIGDLSFPENLENMPKILDTKISDLGKIMGDEIFVRNPNVQEPQLIILDSDKKWKISFSESSTRLESNDLSKYQNTIDSIEKYQNFGHSCLEFEITTSPLLDSVTKAEIMERIFRNEFKVLLCWIEINKLNYLQKPIPDDLLATVREWNFYNAQNYRRMIDGDRLFTDNFLNIFIFLGIGSYLFSNYPEKWRILEELVKDLTVHEGEIKETIESRLLSFIGQLNMDMFRGVCGTPKPLTNFLKTPRKSGYLEDKNFSSVFWEEAFLRPNISYSDQNEEKLLEIVEKIKGAQSLGSSFTNFQIVHNPFVSPEKIRRHFSKIFTNEFGIFLNWMEAIKCKKMGLKIPRETMVEIRKWPRQNEKKAKKILESKRLFFCDIRRTFISLGIRDYLAEFNPDLWAMFLMIMEKIPWNKSLAGKINKFNQEVLRRSEGIRNNLFDGTTNHRSLPLLVNRSERRGIELLDSSKNRRLGKIIRALIRRG